MCAMPSDGSQSDITEGLGNGDNLAFAVHTVASNTENISNQTWGAPGLRQQLLCSVLGK